MPFTLSHAVLAPPISRLTGHRLPTAALAIGCMVPDLYRLLGRENNYQAHYWSALLYPSLCIGLLFAVLWYVLYRPVIYRCLGIQHDLQLHSFKKILGFILYVCLALLCGTATHIIWDGLTHADFRSFAFQETLEMPIDLFGQVYPLHRILQIATSFIALPFLAWMSLQYYQRYQQHLPVSKAVKCWGYSLAIVTLSSGMISVLDYIRYLPWPIWRNNLYSLIGLSFNEFTQIALVVLSLGCMLFLFFDRGRRLG